jgi:DNA-binding CsgD family transcriptional regulator
VGSPQGHGGLQQARPGYNWDTRVRQVQSEEAKGDKANPPRMQATRGAVLLSSHSPPTHASSPPSEREREFLRLVAGGQTNREIASALSISPNAVKVHLHNILDTIGGPVREGLTEGSPRTLLTWRAAPPAPRA